MYKIPETDEEICRAYRLAKNKREQINILADFTQRTPAEIIEILKTGWHCIRTHLGSQEAAQKSVTLDAGKGIQTTYAPARGQICARDSGYYGA